MSEDLTRRRIQEEEEEEDLDFLTPPEDKTDNLQQERRGVMELEHHHGPSLIQCCRRGEEHKDQPRLHQSVNCKDSGVTRNANPFQWLPKEIRRSHGSSNRKQRKRTQLLRKLNLCTMRRLPQFLLKARSFSKL